MEETGFPEAHIMLPKIFKFNKKIMRQEKKQEKKKDTLPPTQRSQYILLRKVQMFDVSDEDTESLTINM